MNNHWNPFEIPQREDGGSRFSLPVTSVGNPSSRAQTVALTYNHLCQGLEEKFQAEPVPATEVPLYAVVRAGSDYDAVYVLRSRGSVYGPRLRQPSADEKMNRFQKKEPAGLIVDKLFLGLPTARDDKVWEAARELAEIENMKGRTLTVFNEALARAIVTRNCLDSKLAHPRVLPQEHLRAVPQESESANPAALAGAV